jgi:hypothetical protein
LDTTIAMVNVILVFILGTNWTPRLTHLLCFFLVFKFVTNRIVPGLLCSMCYFSVQIGYK